MEEIKGTITLSIMGDICPDWGFPDSFALGKPEKVFGDVLPLIREADYAIANLECPASNVGVPIKKTGPNLRCRKSDIAVLKRAGLDAVSLANNHIYDYGETAFRDTMDVLIDNELAFFGAGETREEAKRPLIVEVKGWRVAALSFAEEEFNCVTDNHGGARLFDPYESLDAIRELRKDVDYLIVLYHGGIEEYKLPSPLLQKKCRAMAQAGADIVLCQHSHCIGTAEDFSNSVILYGQGNAIFGRHEGDTAWNQGMLVTIELSDGGAPQVSFRVFEAGTDGIALLSDASQEIRLTKLRNDSSCIDDAAYIKKQWDEFCESKKALYLPMLFVRGRVFNKLNRMIGNALIRAIAGTGKQRIAMNLIRCDSHREVCQTVMENEVFSETRLHEGRR